MKRLNFRVKGLPQLMQIVHIEEQLSCLHRAHGLIHSVHRVDLEVHGSCKISQGSIGPLQPPDHDVILVVACTSGRGNRRGVGLALPPTMPVEIALLERACRYVESGGERIVLQRYVRANGDFSTARQTRRGTRIETLRAGRKGDVVAALRKRERGDKLNDSARRGNY